MFLFLHFFFRFCSSFLHLHHFSVLAAFGPAGHRMNQSVCSCNSSLWCFCVDDVSSSCSCFSSNKRRHRFLLAARAASKCFPSVAAFHSAQTLARRHSSAGRSARSLRFLCQIYLAGVPSQGRCWEPIKTVETPLWRAPGVLCVWGMMGTFDILQRRPEKSPIAVASHRHHHRHRHHRRHRWSWISSSPSLRSFHLHLLFFLLSYFLFSSP